MESGMENVECAFCEYLQKIIDKKGWVRYKCPFCENKEWIGGMCRDPLIHCCHHKKLKKKRGLKYNRQEM